MADGEHTPLQRSVSTSSKSSHMQQQQQQQQQVFQEEQAPTMRQRFLTHITIIARLWTIVAIIVLWAAAVITIKDGVKPLYVGWTLVAISIVVTFLELTWVLDKVACCDRTGCCCACWSVILWVDNWKRGVLYLLMSIPLFLNGTTILLAMLAGFVLVVSGCLYIVKTFRETSYSYSRTELRYVRTVTPAVTVVTHEISTQTEDDKYYAQVSQTGQTSHTETTHISRTQTSHTPNSHAQSATDRNNPFNEPDE